jgi:hypothetical protein
MKNRSAVISCAALAVLALSSLAFASAGEVVKSGIAFVATGTLISRTPDELVVRTDDHGHKVAFVIDRSTVLPDELMVGRHVRIVYHPAGSIGQTADTVAVSAPQTASR